MLILLEHIILNKYHCCYCYINSYLKLFLNSKYAAKTGRRHYESFLEAERISQ